MGNVDSLHQRVDLVTTARAGSGETENLFRDDGAIGVFDHARPCPVDRTHGLLGGGRLFLLGDQTQGDVLLARPVVCSETPLGVAGGPKELHVRVAAGVVELEGERGELFLGLFARDRVVIVVVQALFQSVEEGLDLFVRGGIHDLSYGLVEREVSDDVADEALDVGELASRGGQRQADLGDGDRAGVGLDQLSVQVFCVEDVYRVDASLGCDVRFRSRSTSMSAV